MNYLLGGGCVVNVIGLQSSSERQGGTCQALLDQRADKLLITQVRHTAKSNAGQSLCSSDINVFQPREENPTHDPSTDDNAYIQGLHARSSTE